MGAGAEVIKVKRETFEDIKVRLINHNPAYDGWQMLGGEISLDGYAIEPTDVIEVAKNPIEKIAEAIMRLRHAFKQCGFTAPKAIVLGAHEDENHMRQDFAGDPRHVFTHVDPRDNTLEVCGVKVAASRYQPAYIDTRRIHEALVHMLHHFNEIQAGKDKMSPVEVATGLFEIGDQAMKQLGILMEMVDTHNEKESRRV